MASEHYRPQGFGGFSFFPPVVKNLLIINGVVFFLTLILESVTIGGVRGGNLLYRWFALMPLESGYFEIWQLVSYQFLHAGFGHIFFNMFALWMFGVEIENNLGSRKFLLYYLLAGVGAGLFHLLLTPLMGLPGAPTVGASGAVYAVLIAFGMMFPDRMIYIYFLIPVRAKYLIGFLIILEFLMIDSAGSQVAHLAHLGGAIVGFLFIMFDSSIHVSLKNMLGNSGSRGSSSGWGNSSSSGFGSSSSNPFKRKADRGEKIQDAQFYEINEKEDNDDITQDEIDEILDKISRSGYKNLTAREKRILFEASKRMK